MWVDKKAKDMEKIFSEFIDSIRKIAALTREAVSTACKGEFERSDQLAEDVIKLEKNIDELTAKIEIFLEKHGHALPYLVEDRYTLQELTDDIADKAEFVARLLKIKHVKLPTELSDMMIKMSELVEKVVNMACDAAIMLDTDFDKAYEIANKVEDLREEVRNMEFEILSNLVREEPISAVDVLVMRDRLLALSKMADSAEDMSDKVAGMALKYSR